MVFELCLNPLKRIGGKLPLKRAAKGKGKDKTRKLMKMVKQMKLKLCTIPGLEKQVSGYFHINKELFRELEQWQILVTHRDNRIAVQEDLLADVLLRSSEYFECVRDANKHLRDQITHQTELAALDRERIAQQAEQIQVLCETLHALGYEA